MHFLCNCKESRFIDVALMSGCVCPGDTWTYECTTMGHGSTIWMGTAFDCIYNEIILLHSCFLYGEGAYHSCNNGTIVARSFSVQGNNYTSQLIVTITPDTAGTTVVCGHDNGSDYIIQRSTIIPSPGLPSCNGMNTAN